MVDNNDLTQNIKQGILEEIERVKEIVIVYEEVPKGAGIFAASLMKKDIVIAEEAVYLGDTVQMLRSFEKLKEYDY